MSRQVSRAALSFGDFVDLVMMFLVMMRGIGA
jgi:hypothetical protein